MRKMYIFRWFIVLIVLISISLSITGCVLNNKNVNQDIRIEYLPFKVEKRVLLNETNLHISPDEKSTTLKTLKPNTILSVGDVATSSTNDEVWLFVTLDSYEEPVNIKGWLKKDDTKVIVDEQSTETKNNDENNELSNELVVDLINAGLELYCLFDIDSLPFDTEVRKEFYGIPYYLVNKKNINTMADLKNMLTQVFTKEMSDTILKNYERAYVEEDGKVYTYGLGGGGPYIFWDEIIIKEKEIIDQDTILVYTYLLFPARVDDEPLTYKKEKFEFKRVQGNGWRLNSFYLVR